MPEFRPLLKENCEIHDGSEYNGRVFGDDSLGTHSAATEGGCFGARLFQSGRGRYSFDVTRRCVHNLAVLVGRFAEGGIDANSLFSGWHKYQTSQRCSTDVFHG